MGQFWWEYQSWSARISRAEPVQFSQQFSANLGGLLTQAHPSYAWPEKFILFRKISISKQAGSHHTIMLTQTWIKSSLKFMCLTSQHKLKRKGWMWSFAAMPSSKYWEDDFSILSICPRTSIKFCPSLALTNWHLFGHYFDISALTQKKLHFLSQSSQLPFNMNNPFQSNSIWFVLCKYLKEFTASALEILFGFHHEITFWTCNLKSRTELKLCDSYFVNFFSNNKFVNKNGLTPKIR